MDDLEATCSFCGKTIDVGAAIDAGWSPSFYLDASDMATETGTPVCPECEAAHLDCPDGGELTLKPGHARFLANPPQ